MIIDSVIDSVLRLLICVSAALPLMFFIKKER
jgi:hypothetical protein